MASLHKNIEVKLIIKSGQLYRLFLGFPIVRVKNSAETWMTMCTVMLTCLISQMTLALRSPASPRQLAQAAGQLPGAAWSRQYWALTV